MSKREHHLTSCKRRKVLCGKCQMAALVSSGDTQQRSWAKPAELSGNKEILPGSKLWSELHWTPLPSACTHRSQSSSQAQAAKEDPKKKTFRSYISKKLMKLNFPPASCWLINTLRYKELENNVHRSPDVSLCIMIKWIRTVLTDFS